MMDRLKRYANILGPFLGLVIIIAFFGALEPERFLSFFNMRTVANQSVIVALGALGMTLVMIAGGIDLSVGSNIAFTTVSLALLLKAGLPPPLALLAALGLATLWGLVNGALVTGLRIVPFIATLGTLEIVRGSAQLLAGEKKVDAPSSFLNGFMSPSSLPGLPVSPGILLMGIATVLMALFLRHTVLGRHAFAIGSNENAARLCGVAVEKSKLLLYALAGLFAGLAGFAQFSRLGMGDPTVAVGRELDIVAAVVIGGGSLSGGKGSMLGAVIGSFIMAFLRNGCTMVGIGNSTQRMVIGAIIVLAVALDGWRARR